MSKRGSLLTWLGFTRAETPPGAMPPSRASSISYVGVDRAMTLSTVYRGIQIHATAACQLSMGVWRGDQELERTPALVTRPDLDQSRSAFYEYTVVSLYTNGNAFWRLVRSPLSGEIVDIKPLNPLEVAIFRDPLNNTLTYQWRNETLQARDVKHLRLLRIPGQERGLGPIQAAQVELRGALEARDYGALWLSESNMPAGILESDQVLSPDQAKEYKNVWHGLNADGTSTETGDGRELNQIKVLGQGLSYSSLMLKPADVQFLETQQFTTTQIARLLGLPASLLLAAVEGDSKTYQNVEQDWIAYIRFSLMKALREIEEAFSDLLPHTQVARFKLEVLLRTDTKTRYEGHAIGIRAGFLTINEVRAIEGLKPIDGGDVLSPIQPATNQESINA